MDVQTGIVCVGMVVISAAVILFISMFSMKEKTYEEAIAEQRKLPDDLLSGKKEKSKEKKHKNKAGKKVKEKKEEKEEAEEDRTDHVQFEENPQILTGDVPAQEEKISKGTKKKGKNERVKPILVNKEEPVVLVPDLASALAQTEEANHFEQLLPKDDLELIRSQSKENLQQLSGSGSPSLKTAKDTPTKSKKNAKESKRNGTVKEDATSGAKEAKEPVENVQAKDTPVKEVKETVVPLQSAVKESKNKKKKNDILAQIGGDKDGVGVNISLLSPLVQKAELSRSEIQILINQLLNKQLDNPLEHSEWMEGRADPVIKLKKQLADKEQALEAEREASVGFQNGLKKLRAELNTEKYRVSTSIKQLEEALSTKITETQTLHTRMQHILETHAAEKQGFARQIEQLQTTINDNVAVIHKMQEDQGQTQGHLQQELIAQRKQLELQFNQIREKDNVLEGQLAQKHGEVQELQNLNASLNQELQMLQTTCSNSTGEIEMLRQQLAIMQEQLVHSDKQLQHYNDNGARLQDVARQLEESRRSQNEMEHGLQGARRREQDLLKQINSLKSEVLAAKNEAGEASNAKAELQKVQFELNTLKSDLSNSKNLAQTEAVQMTSLNTKLAKAQSDLTQSQSELTEARNALNNSEATVIKIQSDLITAKQEQTTSESRIAEARKESASLRTQLTKTQDEFGKLQADYAMNQEMLKHANQTVTDLKTTNMEIERLKKHEKNFEPQIEVARLQAENDRLSSQSETVVQLQKEVRHLREENESLSSKLAASSNRENNVEPQAVKNNVDHNNLAEKESALGALRLELANKDSKLSELGSQLEALHRDITNERNQSTRLKNELEAQQAKNNELRTKNWKVMEALSAAESRANSNSGVTVKNKSIENVRTEEQKSSREFLQRLFPEIKISESSHDKWMHLFEEKIASLLEKIRNAKNASSDDQDLREQNQSLQGMVTHYKQIIEDTEAMLNKLEKHIESEEARWQVQLEQKDEELSEIKSELTELQNTSRLTEQLKEKIVDLESRLAEAETFRAETQAELSALRKVRDSSFVKGTRNQNLSENLIQNEVCGVGSSSEQSIPNGAPTSDTSKSEPMLAAQSLMVALEKTPRNTELEQCSLSESSEPNQCRAESGSAAGFVVSKTCPVIEHDAQNNGTPTNGQQHKKHKKKRKSTMKPVAKRRRLAGWFRKKIISKK